MSLCLFKGCTYFREEGKEYCSSHGWNWEKIRVIRVKYDLVVDVMQEILEYLGERPVLEWLTDDKILECVRDEIDHDRKWMMREDCFLFNKRERIMYLRSLSPFLCIHCDSVDLALIYLFGEEELPIYVKTTDILELWKEINSKFVNSWTKIAFQKALVKKCFHSVLLPPHYFGIGLCYNADLHYQMSDRMSSQQVLDLTIKHRPFLFYPR